MIINNTLPKNVTYGEQCWNDPTIQHFRMKYSSEFKYASVKVIEPDVTRIINQLNLIEENICVGDGSFVDEFYIVHDATDVYYK